MSVPSRSAGRKAQILAAAREIVAANGMRALSVRRVAARAGIGPSTMRHYFPTQRALYDVVVGEALDAQLDDLRIDDRGAPPAQRLTECVRQFLPRDESQMPVLHGWFAFLANALGPDGGGQAARLLASMTGHSRARVGSWLAVLEGEGLLQRRDREQHITKLLIAVDGLCLGMLSPGAPLAIAEAHAILAEVVERLVLAEDGSGPPAR